MKEILYILLDNYAEHEISFMPGAVSTDATGFRKEPKYINKMVAPTMEPVKSIGGMRTLPDYSFETMPEDYAALVLIGGFGWMNPEAECVLPIVKDALSKGVVVGAICNAASWIAKQGLLNNIKHTGNGIDQLKSWGGNNYTNEAGYVNEQAIRLDALASNTPAHKIYERLGFEYRGKQHLYAENTGWTDFYFFEYAPQSMKITSS